MVRELVTAPELKLVLGRHAHEENIHADSLLYMISSLGINPHECEAMFEQIDTIRRKNEFVTRVYNSSSETSLRAEDFWYSVTRPSKKFCSFLTSIISASHGNGFSKPG